MNKRTPIHWPSIKAILLEYTICFSCILLTMLFWNIYTVISCMLIVGIRQHALFIIYHDAVHYLISPNKRINDLIINLFVGVPFLVPINTYRSFHLSHHNLLGKEGDPEIAIYHKGQYWNYEPLKAKKLFFQFIGDLTMWNNFKSMMYCFLETSNPLSKMKLVKSKIFPELYLMIFVFLGAWLFLYISDSTIFFHLLLLWFVPFLTITQLIQKIRSFTEHTFNEKGTTSGSWKVNLLGKLTIWPYNINYHREHHEKPNIPWDELPINFPNIKQKASTELWSTLYLSNRLKG